MPKKLMIPSGTVISVTGGDQAALCADWLNKEYGVEVASNLRSTNRSLMGRGPKGAVNSAQLKLSGNRIAWVKRNQPNITNHRFNNLNEFVAWTRNLIAPKIGGHDVQVRSGGVKIGCTDIPWAQYDQAIQWIDGARSRLS